MCRTTLESVTSLALTSLYLMREIKQSICCQREREERSSRTRRKKDDVCSLDLNDVQQTMIVSGGKREKKKGVPFKETRRQREEDVDEPLK